MRKLFIVVLSVVVLAAAAPSFVFVDGAIGTGTIVLGSVEFINAPLPECSNRRTPLLAASPSGTLCLCRGSDWVPIGPVPLGGGCPVLPDSTLRGR